MTVTFHSVQYPPKWCTYNAVRLLHGWCHPNCSRVGASSVYTIQPCTMSRHFMQNHIRRVHACLAVTCHLHFWQNTILTPLLSGLEPETFRSRLGIRRSNHLTIPAARSLPEVSSTACVCKLKYSSSGCIIRRDIVPDLQKKHFPRQLTLLYKIVHYSVLDVSIALDLQKKLLRRQLTVTLQSRPQLTLQPKLVHPGVLKVSIIALDLPTKQLRRQAT